MYVWWGCIPGEVGNEREDNLGKREGVVKYDREGKCVDMWTGGSRKGGRSKDLLHAQEFGLDYR